MSKSPKRRRARPKKRGAMPWWPAIPLLGLVVGFATVWGRATYKESTRPTRPSPTPPLRKHIGPAERLEQAMLEAERTGNDPWQAFHHWKAKEDPKWVAAIIKGNSKGMKMVRKHLRLQAEAEDRRLREQGRRRSRLDDQ